MRKPFALAALLAAATPALADEIVELAPDGAARGGEGRELEPYLQCAPYARQVTGIALYGEAGTWWEQAQGRYATGRTPRVGAVMTFRPHGTMRLGHVAAVSRLLDSRRVLLDHANWSPVDGRRGQVEKDVLALDVSPANDWSQVQVWYAPLGRVGTTAWPVAGFIYADREPQQRARAAAPRIEPAPARKEPSPAFLSAFADFQ
ncbi:MAG: CHAP domain-containing protein [Erythrobacter sp.]|jgi:surface antigen